MQYKITVTPDNGQRADWEIHYFESDGVDTVDPELHHIPFNDSEDGSFSAMIELGRREYGLTCDVIGPGKKIEVDITPAPTIVQAPGDEWPLTAKVPDLMQRDLIVIYFNTGDGQ